VSFKIEKVGGRDKIATDADGNVYHLKASEHTIAVYDREMRLRQVIGRPGQAPGELQHPRDFAVGRSGAIHVADTDNRRVQIFDSAGQFIGGFDVGYRPTAIKVNSQDEIFIRGARVGEHIINVYSTDGKLLRSFGEPRSIDFKKLSDKELPEDYMKRLTAVLSEGMLDIDQSDNVYIAFNSAPILRKYDRFGKLLFEIETRNARLDGMLPRIIEGLKEKIERRSLGYKGVILCLAVDSETENVWVKTVAPGIFVYDSDGQKLGEVEMINAEGKMIGPAGFEVKATRVLAFGWFPTPGIHIFEKPVFEQPR
jgi:hypothetical protein